MNLVETKIQANEALKAAEAIVTAAEQRGGTMTEAERESYDTAISKFKSLSRTAKTREEHNTIKEMLGPGGVPHWIHDPGASSSAPVRISQKRMSEEYTAAFLAFARSGGKHASSVLSEGFDPLFGGFALPAMPRMSGALYEGVGGGSDGSGGYAVSVPTDQQISVLALPDLGVRSIARVIPTATDIKMPVQSTFGTAGVKAESGSSSNLFSESDPSLAQFTLSAWMIGLTHTVSWELLQDVAMFQEFGVRDLLNAIDIAEDGYFISGSGSNQPQGLVGNVGTGTGAAFAVESTGQYLLNGTLETIATLKAQYFRTAGWLMNRATSTAIRQAQQQANLYNPAWTRENGRDYLHGYPVTYSATMPNIPTATTAGVTPILFGSFTDGYVIGDRGGSGTFVKILDQPLATAGQTVLLGYKRVDGRVRLTEAIQQVSVSHS